MGQPLFLSFRTKHFLLCGTFFTRFFPSRETFSSPSTQGAFSP